MHYANAKAPKKRKQQKPFKKYSPALYSTAPFVSILLPVGERSQTDRTMREIHKRGTKEA